MNEPEYERTYDASDNHDELEYVYYLWTRTTEQGSIQRKQKSAAKRKKSVQQKETGLWWWQEDDRTRPATCSIKRVPKRLLLSTGTKAADWTKRQSPKSRKRKVKGTSKGSGKMAMQPVRETLQGISDQAYIDTIAYNLRYNLTRGNTK